MINIDNFKRSFKDFETKTPFPFTIIDDFFQEDIALKLSEEFPDFDSDDFNGKYKSSLEYKQTCNIWDRFPKLTYSIFTYLNSFKFISTIIECTNIEVYPDYGLHTCGWHLHPTGGTLNPHLDYSLHPKLGLQRKYNIIVYLNPNWKPSWGGELGLWTNNSETNSPEYLKKIIEPKFNRGVFFDCSGYNWHGILNSVNFPKGENRKSIAISYLTNPIGNVNSRGRALYAPTDEQKNDQEVLSLIQRRSQASNEDPNKWIRN